MKMPALERTSAAKAGWVIIVLTVGWSVFLLLPDPPKPAAPQAATIAVPVTSLTRSGLRDNADWDGLPEFFALWADQAEWHDGRTRFVYWNPVMKDYSYEFEATRTKDGYTFREVNKMDTSLIMGDVLVEDCPIRFLYRPRDSNDPLRPKPVPKPEKNEVPGKVEVDLAVSKNRQGSPS
jgi:hypothetical protein